MPKCGGAKLARRDEVRVTGAGHSASFTGESAALGTSANPAAEVRFQAHGDLTGEWDADRLRQVVSNLLGNAAHHGGGAGPVGLSAAADGTHVRLVVRNGAP